ncbi:MAG: sigma-70 family RNA polymerase sigma factor [Armatimonadota bacterium]|nr:sigma-70 family RNA polymerase sigma factor [Armatimonadota bacterium]
MKAFGADQADADRADQALVEAAQNGSAEAFGVLADRYHGNVYGIVYRMCGGQDAADLTQEIFLRALRALRKFQFHGDASFRTWLYRIAVNVCINELRRRKRRAAVEGPSLDEDLEREDGTVPRAVPDETRSPHVMAERAEIRRAVQAIVATLSPKHRAALTLVDLQQLDYEEAATVLECPLGTLKSRLARARRQFAEKWQDYEDGKVSI